MTPQTSETVPRPIRCAIYTRKSTEEGLQHEFNSLAAQRDAAQAYIVSQQAQGWALLPEIYNDGGFTGANMERPALARLLSDIEAGRIDCVVVYKVDRLSRSLLDFARIMGLFEKHAVSFVSVTQQFNTATPVGRLTLHILLSFAQFEREIISERTRDNKAAARRKGKWTGGYVPLGYDLQPGAGGLVVNEAEAMQVRTIFELFAQTRSFAATLHEITRRGWAAKSWKTANGKQHPGRAFNEASLARVLANPIYAGSVRQEGRLYRGQHRAIISERQWKRASGILGNIVKAPPKARNRTGAVLKGLLHCGACGKPMAVTCTSKQQRCYRYYVCRSSQDGCNRDYLRAEAIERSVMEHLHKLKYRGMRSALKTGQGACAANADTAALLQSLIETVVYDAETAEVMIRLRSPQKGRHEL